MKEQFERKYLIEIIKKFLDLNIENCKFMKELYKGNKQIIDTLNKSIRQSKKSLEIIHQYKHIEVLRAIYGDCIGKIQGQLMIGGTLITSKTTLHYDRNEKAFKEFLNIQEENKKIYEQKLKEQRESQIAIEKAKEQGKKIEYMVDPITKKLKPIVVESENNNA